MKILKISWIVCLGLALGISSVLLIAEMVERGILCRYGLIGVVSFPVYEEVVKAFLVFLVIIIFQFDFFESMYLSMSTGIGFRLLEILIYEFSIFTFVVPAFNHGVWVSLSVIGFFYFREKRYVRAFVYIVGSVFFHLGWNVLVNPTHYILIREFLHSII